MTQRFAVVYENTADFHTATELADRVLVESIDWIKANPELLEHQREWLSRSVDGGPLTWKNIKQLAQQTGIKAHGHFNGQSGEADAAAARRAIRFLLKAISDISAVVLIRDQDDQPQRRYGLEQARQQDHNRIAIVVGVAIVERECWVISGFDPQCDDESSRFQAESNDLGLDLRCRNNELTACKDDNAKRSPKRVLRVLSGDDRERERRCWRETSLAFLLERGIKNGLADYLHEIRDRLARLIGYVPVD